VDAARVAHEARVTSSRDLIRYAVIFALLFLAYRKFGGKVGL
jgi:hypothetical protein